MEIVLYTTVCMCTEDLSLITSFVYGGQDPQSTTKNGDKENQVSDLELC